MADEYIKANNIRSILKVAVSKLVKEQPKNARTFLAQSISGARQIDTTRLMLVSSDIPDRTDFLGMVKCLKAQYDSETQTSGELVAIIRALVAAHGKFKSIALASHGPAGSTWVISSKAIIDLADDLANQRTGGGLAVLEALAEAVQTGGRVDLLACNLIASPQGKAFLQDLEKRTGCNFAASVDKTGNPKDSTTDWIMESDDVDIRELYFTDTTLFDGTFNNDDDKWGDEDQGEEDDEDDEARSNTRPVEAHHIKKGNYIMLKGHPCKIKEVKTSKTGKHGHAKCNITGVDVTDSKKYNEKHPGHITLVAFDLKKTDYDVLEIDNEDPPRVSCLGDDNTTSSFALPKGELGENIRRHQNNGDFVRITVLTAPVGEQKLSLVSTVCAFKIV